MELFIEGFNLALTPTNLFFCFVGVFLGTFIGVLPGVGALTAISLLFPISFHLEPLPALVMLAGVYYGAEYGGSTASILLNLPGTPSNAVTCLDGYPMTQKGRAGVALLITTIASFIGGSIGIVLLIFFTPMMVALALSFGPAEYFAAMVFGLIAAGTIAQGSPAKGMIMVMLGLLLGSVGVDISSGTARYTMGSFHLYDGISIAIVAMGLFGVAEIIASANKPYFGASKNVTLLSMIPTRDDVRRIGGPMLRGTAVGSAVGPLPGTGPSVAAFLSYALEKKVSRRSAEFGKGAVEGVAAPESANNAAIQTAFIPTLALGIPGSATMAVLLGALMIHGISPGPRMLTEYSDVFWGLVASFWIGNILLLVLNIPLIGIWVKLLSVPYQLLYPAILSLICIGVYSLNNSIFDVGLVLFFGVIGYGMRLLDFEPAPLLVGFVLGPMLEEYFRRAMLLARGDVLVILQRPVAGSLLVLAALVVSWLVFSPMLRKRQSGNRTD